MTNPIPAAKTNVNLLLIDRGNGTEAPRGRNVAAITIAEIHCDEAGSQGLVYEPSIRPKNHVANPTTYDDRANSPF